MTTDEIRQKFLDFFRARGHKIVRSDSLVPQNDPTLLFTSAGMNQFKDYFLGLKKDLKRAASCQKCLRTGDLDEVGKTPYHHSFFEMLGNFSFGDYFKEEAIRWAWEFLTVELRLPRQRLRVSVHQDDEEALKIWRDDIKVREDWIYKMGDKTNFWPSHAPQEGPNGPCGPCSEIYYDQTPKAPDRGSVDDDPGRFAEIWNLVFTQFDRQEGGKLLPLKNKNIDTGMGLERLACVLQGKKTNFEIDIFLPLNQAVEECLQTKVSESSRKSLYAASDHIRAVVFAIADGVIPSNEGRGYVVRKLIRRALWQTYEVTPHKRALGIFLDRIVPVVISVMSAGYPELKQAEKNIVDTVKAEEEHFEDTLARGRGLLLEELETLKQKGRDRMPGELVFKLYDTYGLPDETTRSIAAKKGFQIDQEGFDRLMSEQRKRAKGKSPLVESIFVTSEFDRKLHKLPPTKFLGYETHQAGAKILMSQVEGDRGVVVLDQTPFYAESGGQVGDQGMLEGPHFQARVEDTQKKDNYYLHSIRITKGKVENGTEIEAKIDSGRRDAAMRNHTATHLLHAVLREVLGKQVRQLGSLVHPDRLRFDYSFSRPLTEEELLKIESRVNEEILKDTPLQKELKDFEQAKSEGALAFFGEKYGDRVRVVSVPGISKEFCGGTHCERTGQIGIFTIISDSSIASGVRRIEALTGTVALQYIQTARSQLRAVAEKLRSSVNEVPERIEKLQERVRTLEKSQFSKLPFDPKLLLSTAPQAGPFPVVVPEPIGGMSVTQLRNIYFESIRTQQESALWCLGSESGGKAYFIVGASGDLVNDPSLNMPQIANYLASKVDGKGGGGRADFAQAGTSNVAVFENNWGSFPQFINDYLKKIQNP